MIDLTKRKARKDHRCSFCGLVIARRATYFEIQLTPWSHPDNDRFHTSRAHLACWSFWHIYGDDCEYMWDDSNSFEQDQFKRALATRQTNSG